MMKRKKGGGGHCVILISDKWYIYENFSLSSKFLLKGAFLIFGRYNNFQLDNFHYNSEYSNFSYTLKHHWMNEYLAFQLCIQVFWKVVLVYSVLYITVQCLSLLVIDIEETYV